ncbi:FAD dependent oxidoreductase [Saitoella complicata NRRL Y-17804]|nr:FAD dependent oxidoreductase [Saitoella complicata NRRL Y-17804]ODQ51911.1 FAD dependent oxidoreductase [Saitoella complicata NRRL Y-17804]
MSTENITIIGAGVIGATTAYYLTRHPKYDLSKYKIRVIEATEVAAGASGKAGGLLALDWHGPSTANLGELSYNLHKQLADEHGGFEKWGYRALTTMSISTSFKPRRTANLPPGLDWVNEKGLEKASLLGTEETTAQVHPYKFTNEMMRLAREKGVELIMGKVTDVKDGSVTYVSKDTNEEKTLDSTQTIVTAGPWTPKILKEAPISATRAHSITIRPKKPVSAHALFTSMTLSSGKTVAPELYARPDEVYVCGEGDHLTSIPETADKVEVIQSRCDDLVKQAGELSSRLKEGEVLACQACYLPVMERGMGGPMVGAVPGRKGVWVAAGHSCWGISLSAGTGKVLSEMILDGEAKSCDVGMLDPSEVL